MGRPRHRELGTRLMSTATELVLAPKVVDLPLCCRPPPTDGVELLAHRLKQRMRHRRGRRQFLDLARACGPESLHRLLGCGQELVDLPEP